MPLEEVIVIGSGAVGAACAAALARLGRWVRVLSVRERSTTAVSGGHLLLQSKAPGPGLEAARRSLELVREFVLGREADMRYEQRGSLILAASDEESAALHAHFERLRGAGIPVEWQDGEAARALEPSLSPGVTFASYCPADAQIHPRLLAEAWLVDAAAHGAVVERDAPVERLLLKDGAVRGVVAGGVQYDAAAVVAAAGPWSGGLVEDAGVDLGMRPRRGALLRAQPGFRLASRPLLGAEYLSSKFGDEPASVAFSFQQHADGEAILGGSREFAGFSTDGVEPLAERILANAARYLPAVQGMRWSDATVGFRPWMGGGQPRIGTCEVPGLYLACGHEGDGITLAAVTAERIAALLTGNDATADGRGWTQIGKDKRVIPC